MPAEGETIFSLFTRCKATSGFLEEVILQELTGQRLKSRLLSPLPAYLPSIAEKLHKSHPCTDPLLVIRDHTLFPYLSYFMSVAVRAEYGEGVASTDWTHPIALSMGLTKYPVSLSTAPRFCQSCIKEGIGEYGFPYFRRQHQLPGVYYCWKHREILFHGCKRCGEYPLRGAALALAGECRCEQGIDPLPAASVYGMAPEPFQWLAEESAQLLTCHGFPASDPAAALRQKVLDDGCIRAGVIDFRQIAEKVRNFWGDDFLRLLNITVLSGDSAAPWIRRFFNSNRGNRSTILYLLMIGAYFDSVRQYELWSSSEPASEEKAVRKVVDLNGLRRKHRQILENSLRENVGMSRGDFQQKAPGSYDFLLRHDKEFFQSKIQRAKAISAPRRERVDWIGLDGSKAAELKGLFDEEYTKVAKPIFITTTSALTTCRIFSKYRADSSRFPRVTETLSKNLEDRDSFHKRRLRWAINEMVRTRTPISANRLRRVADLELKVLQRNRNFILATIDQIGGDLDSRSFLI